MASDSADSSISRRATVQRVVVSAPGSTMLFGEHAVLYGEAAIACAVETRLRVEAALRDDRRVVIRSSLGGLETDLDRLAQDHTHRFTLALLEKWKNRLPGGLDLAISSDFSHKVGLGSSAALTVAVAGALRSISGLPLRPRTMLDECLAVVQEVQGSGSGTDLVASLYGGIVHYRPATRSVTPLGEDLPLTLYYSGYKTPTPEVIAHVTKERALIPSLYDHLFRVMGECTQQATGAIREHNMTRLGRCMNVYNGLMEGLGICDKTLSEMVHTLRQQGAEGVKISGSGLGDCVIALGNAGDLAGYDLIPVPVAKCGVYLEPDAD
ncbi:mevalonate kinase [Sansalvadorimonas sp. 2012CJ34-2]|uniref:Mevalonate kinase n=1 Tax=Parendozoicomonas callyspongiae TaxID=2942213 RepID=A0ABT0PHH1_9GAMM|nr:mevalonate kinase [Sansalvadorimonas sp. 2012CJ34-2]MCL6270809.1 mevalonate kinase [Sansalvadorimonas sp. 2012CJ34-2]